MHLSIAKMRSFPFQPQKGNTYTTEAHTTHSHSHSQCAQPAFCLEQSKYLPAGMTASFYWRWNRRVIKQVSAGRAEIHCFYESYFKNEAWHQECKAEFFCIGKNVVKGSHPSCSFQDLEEAIPLPILQPCLRLQWTLGFFHSRFPNVFYTEQAKKSVVFPM